MLFAIKFSSVTFILYLENFMAHFMVICFLL